MICYNRRWITREELVERGFEKLINETDGKQAAQQKVDGGVCCLHVPCVSVWSLVLMHQLAACTHPPAHLTVCCTTHTSRSCRNVQFQQTLSLVQTLKPP